MVLVYQHLRLVCGTSISTLKELFVVLVYQHLRVVCGTSISTLKTCLWY